MMVFANGGNNPCRSMSLRGWVCLRKALRSLDRRASCPIVTFQTERQLLRFLCHIRPRRLLDGCRAVERG